MLSNPLHALHTMEKNWAKVAQIIAIVIYTVIMIFDTCVIFIDA